MGLDESRRIHEVIRERWKPIAGSTRQGSAPRIGIEFATEDGEVQVGTAAHAGDVREHLPLRDHRARPETRPRPYVPVLRDHDALSGLVPDDHATFERRVDYVASDDPIGGGSYGLDAGADVNAGVQPDLSCRGAAP